MLNASDRRDKLMRILFQRRSETISNLARDLNVSKRTVLRDISILMWSEPISTRTGRYGGGVYIVEGANSRRLYMKDDEIEFFKDLAYDLENKPEIEISSERIQMLKDIITLYKKPKK